MARLLCAFSQVLVMDGGNPALSSSTRVVVTVDDVNDNAPEFLERFYKVHIPSALVAEPNSVVLQVFDADLHVRKTACRVPRAVHFACRDSVERCPPYRERKAEKRSCSGIAVTRRRSGSDPACQGIHRPLSCLTRPERDTNEAAENRAAGPGKLIPPPEVVSPFSRLFRLFLVGKSIFGDSLPMMTPHFSNEKNKKNEETVLHRVTSGARNALSVERSVDGRRPFIFVIFLFRGSHSTLAAAAAAAGIRKARPAECPKRSRRLCAAALLRCVASRFAPHFGHCRFSVCCATRAAFRARGHH